MKEKVSNETQRLDQAGVDTGLQKISAGISQIWIGVIMILAGLIGLWGAFCLLSGLVDGGLIETVAGYIAAVTGK